MFLFCGRPILLTVLVYRKYAPSAKRNLERKRLEESRDSRCGFRVFAPQFGKYLDMVPITFVEFLIIVALSSIGAIIIELSKYFRTKDEKISL